MNTKDIFERRIRRDKVTFYLYIEETAMRIVRSVRCEWFYVLRL